MCFGLIIAEDKTKTMVFNADFIDEPIVNLNLTDETGSKTVTPLGHVDAFTYLGHRASSTDKNLFLKSLTQAGWSAYTKNSKTLEDRKIALKTRVSFLNSLVRSVMLYSSQATCHTEAQLKKLDALYNKFLRKMVNKGFKNTVVDDNGNYRPQMTNEVLHKVTNTEPVRDFVEKQYLSY